MADELNTQTTTPAATETTVDPAVNSDRNDPNSQTAIDLARKERERANQLEKDLSRLQVQMKAFEGIDPAAYKKALEAAHKLEEEREKAAQLESKLKADIAAQYEPQIQEYQAKLTDAEKRLINYQITTELEREYHRFGGYEGEFTVVQPLLMGRVQRDPQTGETIVLDKTGKQRAFVEGNPMTVPQLIAELKKENLAFARHFRGDDRGGIGLSGNGSQYIGGRRAIQMSDKKAFGASLEDIAAGKVDVFQ